VEGDGSPSSESEARRFACDSNPVVMFLDDPHSRLQEGQTSRGDVGGWYNGRITTEPQINSASKADSLPKNTFLLPPRPSQEALVNIFFCRIHPILPLLDECDTISRFRNGTLYPPLLQAICLVAAKDHAALSLLHFESNNALLPLGVFSQRLHQDTLKHVPRRPTGNRITLIQTLALLCLHEWGPHGSEDSSLSLVQAIHHAQTIGLHLQRPGKEPGPQMKALFWTLWSLDRWNSAIHGRSVILHDCDLGQSVIDIIPSFDPPFRIWLHLANSLNRVIASYRPMVDGSSENPPSIPTFTELLNCSDAWDASPEILSSLEFFHHAVVLLSTHSNELQGRSPTRESVIRQSQSILTVAALCRRIRMEDLLPISISAYTLSLALSITYRHVKRARLSTDKIVAIENLTVFHQCLVSLSGTWWLAAMMMRLGRHALENTQALQNIPITNPVQAISRHEESTLTGCPVLVSGTPLNSYRTPRSIDTSVAAGREPQPISVASPGHKYSGEILSPDLDQFFGDLDFASVEEGYFDTFFQNFLDVNLPTTLDEQILGQ
ncbi:hypothetical protein N7468_003907, partial [Penicillium chermesinum]